MTLSVSLPAQRKTVASFICFASCCVCLYYVIDKVNNLSAKFPPFKNFLCSVFKSADP
jgi:hypothetical protein